MQNAGIMNVRKFEFKDRERVREIFFNTVLLGEPASLFFEGKDIISDALTLYFTDYEPQSCFVAEVDSRVVGCLIGAKDRVLVEKTSFDKIYPRLIWKAITSGAFLKIKNLRFICAILVSAVKGEFRLADILKDYPATLHINIDKGFRALDIGTGLINAYLNYLKSEGIRGVSLATMSEGAAKFFEKQGFKLLYKGKRSYFKFLLRKVLPIYIYAKSI
ncbi:MAG: GNAT family N-acetyltransferase [Candidatus Omnitrophica bacterium]|nr:GNAT family N-acetyltransferase [Candidatus Omnitrophota bacterium]